MAMARIWRNRIIAGAHTYSEVPQTWKAKVKNLFQTDVIRGEISPEQYRGYVGESYMA